VKKNRMQLCPVFDFSDYRYIQLCLAKFRSTENGPINASMTWALCGPALGLLSAITDQAAVKRGLRERALATSNWWLSVVQVLGQDLNL
jgi:hypothetical protein